MRLRGISLNLLWGVGTGENFWKGGEIAIHLRRALSETEQVFLSPEWLALPAIDEAG